MPTSPTPLQRPFPVGLRPVVPQPYTTDLNRIAVACNDRVERRRMSAERGRGLEVLGHAIEYLIDSRMYRIDEPHTRADSEATQILMRLSRQIFHESTDGPSPTRRLRLWFADRLGTPVVQ